MVLDQISTIQQNGHSTLGWVFIVVSEQVVPFSEEKGSRCCSENQHSLSAREAFSAIPSLSRKYTNFDVVRGLVKISAICSSVWMYCNFRAPLCTRSLMKWYLISMCFDLSWNNNSLKALCNSDYRNGWSLSQAFSQTDQITNFWAKLLPYRHRLQQYTLPQLYSELWNSASCWKQEIIANPILKQ